MTIEYREDETIAALLGRAEDTDDVYEQVTLYRGALVHLLALLHVEHHLLHPTYGNTAYRGRGVGGQTFTQQCSVIRPEGGEQLVLWQIDDAIRQGFRAFERQGRSVLEYQSRNVSLWHGGTVPPDRRISW